MNKSVIAAIFAVGLAVVGWVGWGFVGSSPLALAMTAVIAAVYVLGAYELMQFRAATSSLSTALAGLGQKPPGGPWWLAGAPAFVLAQPGFASGSTGSVCPCRGLRWRRTWWGSWSCWACWAPFWAWW